MKNKFLSLLFILTFAFTASAQDTTSLYQQNADSLFRYLDKSPIGTPASVGVPPSDGNFY